MCGRKEDSEQMLFCHYCCGHARHGHAHHAPANHGHRRVLRVSKQVELSTSTEAFLYPNGFEGQRVLWEHIEGCPEGARAACEECQSLMVIWQVHFRRDVFSCWEE